MRTQKDREDDDQDEKGKPFSTKAHDEQDEKDEKRLKELRKKDAASTLTAAESTELEELEAKAAAPDQSLPVPPKDLTPAQTKHLLAEARQIFIDHVTKLGGVGGPLGPIGDRMVAFLTKYDGWTHPTQLPADDKDLEGLPKEEKERITKERKAAREKAAKDKMLKEDLEPDAHILPAKEPKEHDVKFR